MEKHPLTSAHFQMCTAEIIDQPYPWSAMSSTDSVRQSTASWNLWITNKDNHRFIWCLPRYVRSNITQSCRYPCCRIKDSVNHEAESAEVGTMNLDKNLLKPNHTQSDKPFGSYFEKLHCFHLLVSAVGSFFHKARPIKKLSSLQSVCWSVQSTDPNPIQHLWYELDHWSMP